MMKMLFSGEVVNGVKLLEFNYCGDYDNYELAAFDENEIIDGIEYQPHYAFINIENDECPYIGIMYRDLSGENDVIFRVFGAKYEVNHNGGYCDFDTMMALLTN